jgi:hypothetical protein
MCNCRWICLSSTRCARGGESGGVQTGRRESSVLGRSPSRFRPTRPCSVRGRTKLLSCASHVQGTGHSRCNAKSYPDFLPSTLCDYAGKPRYESPYGQSDLAKRTETRRMGIGEEAIFSMASRVASRSPPGVLSRISKRFACSRLAWSIACDRISTVTG